MVQHIGRRKLGVSNRAIIAAVGLVAAPLMARADEFNFKVSSGDWSVNTNWTDASGSKTSAPGSSDDAYIGGNDTATVSTSINAQLLFLGSTWNGGIVSSTAGNLTIANNGSLLVNNATLSNGSVLTFSGDSGYFSAQTASLSGSTMNVINGSAEILSNSPSNSLVVTNGSTFTANGSQVTTDQMSFTNSTLLIDNYGEIDANTTTLDDSTVATVTSGGQLQVGHGDSLNISDGSSLTVQLASNAVAGKVNVGASGTGTLSVKSDSQLFAQEIDISPGGSSALFDGEDTIVNTSVLGALGNVTVQNSAALTDSSAGISNATVTVTGGGSTWSTGSMAVGIAGYGGGNVSIQAGGAVNVSGGVLEDFASTITVNGSGTFGGASSLTATGNIYVGYTAASNLTAQAGAYVSDLNGFVGYQTGSTGTVLIDNSTWNNTQGLFVNASGSLTIQNGASVNAATASFAATSKVTLAANSSLTVTGNLANNIAFTDNGTATLGSMSGTGTVTDNGTLAFNPGSFATVSNSISGPGVIAMTGSGKITVSGNNSSFLGTISANSGTLQIGNASALGTSALNVGVSGQLDLNGFNASVTSLTGGGVIDNVSAGGTSTFTVNSSANSTFNGSIRSSSGTVNLIKNGTGTLALAGANTYNGTTTISSGSTLALDNTNAMPVDGNITNNGKILVNANSVAGHVTGSGSTVIAPGVTFVTDFTQSSLVNNGTIYLDGTSSIGNISGNGLLQIGAGAAVTLGSTGGVNDVSGLSEASGSTLDITNGGLSVFYGFASHQASTDSLILSELSNASYNENAQTGTGIISSALTTNTQYAIGEVDGNDNVAGSPIGPDTLQLAYTLKGDLNLDGIVNGTDFSILVTHFGQPLTGIGWEQGDINGDGIVNGTDFSALVTNFGAANNSAAFSQNTGGGLVTVPEPASGMLLIGSLGFLSCRRRRLDC